MAGAAEGCHCHGIFPNHPLETCSGSGGARGDSGGADLCERGEGPPFAAPPPSGQTNPGASQISSPATPGTAVPGSAAPKALPAATAVPEAAPAAAVTLVAQPAAIVPGGRPAVLTAPMAPPAATLALPPAEPACQIIATLLHTLPSVGESLPLDHPLRAICLQTGGSLLPTANHG
nr:oleosin-B6-like [Rhipicephalus microplus]